jgi:6-hydroxycyclohex-1-ene-1-carbonyl-CoA dehydrogenase
MSRSESAGAGGVIVEVAGCGVCHTDFGFLDEGVPTRTPFPLTLGHEISGRVVETAPGAETWLGRSVVVPAVIPCGECAACRAGRGTICPGQIFPGNDVHGGFGTHVRVPANGLCPVPDLTDAAVNPGMLDLADLAVVADAVTTPFQAIRRSGLVEGDLAVFVGAGGIGGFGVQIARALGAVVAAVDVNDERLGLAADHGASLTLRPDAMTAKDLRKAVRDHARDIPTWRHRIFETSGNPAGQQTAFGLLGRGSYMAVVGYTPAAIEIRLSNLMALDARMEGNWGCAAELYPAALSMVLSGEVSLRSFIEKRPLASINETFQAIRERRIQRRVILVPESR